MRPLLILCALLPVAAAAQRPAERPSFANQTAQSEPRGLGYRGVASGQGGLHCLHHRTTGKLVCRTMDGWRAVAARMR